MKKIFKNLSYSVLANGINTLVSLVLVLIVPKVLGVEEYAYWQLYVFYTSYVGFFHFGWADGVYLRFGGKNYEELDKGYFNTQFWLLSIMEVLIAIVVAICAIAFIPDVNEEFILIMTGLCCVAQIPRTFLQYLLQTTNRITDYAKNYMLEKAIYAVLVLSMLFMGIQRFELLVCCDLIARTITLFLLVRQCKDIVIRKTVHLFGGLKEAWVNISVGCKLMFANIASLLITGVVRFAVNNHWDVSTFGKVSLTMTVSNLLMVFIGAVSVVMYPILKTTSEEKLPEIYATLRTMLMVPVLGLLLVYYPAKVILSAWLPQYADSLRYMALLFPMCVFESKMSMLINTYLKALRREKVIMWINWISVAVAVILTGITVYGMDNLTFAIAMLPIILGVRCTLGELILAKQLGISVARDIVLEWILSLTFIISGWIFESWWCMLIYGVAYVLYLVFTRKEVIQMITLVKNKLKKK